MNYIVFDLEWNQPVNEKSISASKGIFEIIEIGAVKLDDNRNIISEFSRIVKPQIYKKLNWHIQKMLKITMQDLMKGDTFPLVMKEFLNWCGEEPVFLSWGSQDLTELQHNMDYYNMEPLGNGPIAYYDVQKLYGIQTHKEENTKGLETAIDEMQINKDIPFHRAYSDAYYTAKVFKNIKKEIVENGLVYNIYHLPVSKKKEIHKKQGKEYTYISQGYLERTGISDNRKVLAINCPECLYRPVRPKVRWFSTNSKIYYGAAICIYHGPIKGKLKIRKHQTGLYFAEKVLTYTSYNEIEEIKKRKNSVKKKSTVQEDSSRINSALN